MKKLIYILPLFFSLISNAQPTDSTEYWAPYIAEGEFCPDQITSLFLDWRPLNTTDNDSTGTHSGEVSTDITYGEGYVGYSAIFNGTTSNINLGVIPITGSGFSMGAWVKADTVRLDNMRIIGRYYNQHTLGINTLGNWNGYVNGTVCTSTTPADTNWHHIFMTYDSTLVSDNIKIYLDGILITSEDESDATVNDDQNWVIGAKGDAGADRDPWDGRIDEVRFYSFVLDPAQVLTLYEQDHSPIAYYVSPTGSDANDGLTTSTPFTTIAKAQDVIVHGDSVLLERGGMWRENFTPVNGYSNGNTHYADYGTGSKPKLQESRELNEEADWTLEGGNVWVATDTFPVDVGNIIYSNEASTGVKYIPDSLPMDTQGDFYFHLDSHKLKLYSVGNPSTVYSDIECALPVDIISSSSISNVSFKNLDLRYGGDCGFNFANGENIYIGYCDLSYIGGYNYGLDSTGNRRGNAIQFWENTDGAVVEYCNIFQIYDAGLTNQGTTTGKTQNNIVFRNNTVDSCEYSYEVFLRDEGSVMDSIFVINNTLRYAGYGWSHNQRPLQNGTNIRIAYNTAVSTNNFITGNILYNSVDRSVYFNVTDDVDIFTIDNNCYYEEAGDIGHIQGTTYDYATEQEAYKSATGQDANSTFEDCLAE
jgi:hypothetical protein